MGELRKFYAHADVVCVGRTLVDLGEKQHGSDMIEPAALGKPTIVGPFTGNFAEVMNAFRAAGAMIELSITDKTITDKTPLDQTAERLSKDLAVAVSDLLRDSSGIGEKAREVVVTQRGATDRTMAVIIPLLTPAENAV